MNKPRLSLRFISYIFLIFFTLFQVGLAITSRPVQDDYGFLSAGANNGFGKYVGIFWKSMGGNLDPVLIRIPFYIPSISGNSWIGFQLYSFLTTILIFSTSLIITTWVTSRSIKQFKLIDCVIAAAVSFGFEGIFTPGILSAYVFGAASSVHLWPISFLILGLWLCTLNSRFHILIFISALVAGNANMAEGATSVFIAIVLLYLGVRKNTVFKQLGFFSLAKVLAFGAGSTLGFLIIVSAPGLKQRANGSQGLPDGFSDLLIRARSSFVAFTGDVATHPVWVLLLLSAFIWGTRFAQELSLARARALISLTFILYSFLIIGSTFAYSAWHQSVGLLFLLSPTGLVAGLLLKRKLKTIRFNRMAKAIVYFLISFSMILSFRVGFLAIERSVQWDSNFDKNICALGRNSEASLLGAEILYRPAQLGISDVNTWPWMRDGYAEWVLGKNFTYQPTCD